MYHFALMPNHVHLVLQVVDGPALSKAMQGLNLSYSLYYRKRYKYLGHLWQGRFKSLVIDRESYLLECGRYVELNPVRAHLARDPREYAWSSYRTYAEGLEHPLIAIAANPLYEQLGASAERRQQAYRQFIRYGMAQDQARRAQAQIPTPLFRLAAPTPQGLEQLLGLRRPGRPNKILAGSRKIEASPFSITVLKNEK